MKERPLADLQSGQVSRLIYSDDSIYRQELERIFACCWLFLGHESMLPQPGDYLTTWMGEDPIIVCRDAEGRVHALLNSCRHRGNRVCLFERGNASVFTCSYHGWSYNTAGQLTGVPFHTEAYYGELDRDRLGLAEVPRLQSYGGLLFGCWDPDAPSLAEYLGEMAWYLERLLLVAEDLGGLEVIATSRYAAHGNWKIPAENFAGDHYHNPTTHGSSYKLGLRAAEFAGPQGRNGPFELALGPGHGLGGLYTGEEPYERDLAQAQRLGSEVADYVRQRYRCLHERLRGSRSQPYSFSHANIFPNCALWGGGAFRGNGIFLFQPKGPLDIEVWQLVALPRQAPEAIRNMVLAQFGQGGHFGSGLFEQDDADNFERVTENTRGAISRRYPFHYGMGLRQEGNWPGSEEWDIHDLPGLVGPRFSEHAQRRFYAHWAHLMAAGS